MPHSLYSLFGSDRQNRILLSRLVAQADGSVIKKDTSFAFTEGDACDPVSPKHAYCRRLLADNLGRVARKKRYIFWCRRIRSVANMQL